MIEEDYNNNNDETIISRPRESKVNISNILFGFLFLTPPNMGKEVFFNKKKITIGRDEKSDIWLDDLEVSRKHAAIVVEKKHYILRDLDSTNGTFHNGKKIREIILKYGDRVKIGSVSMKVVLKNRLTE
ncbi:FHA domain-containing protein, partial [bacterium]|nr:FHA domain-containing protein [bacterium]